MIKRWSLLEIIYTQIYIYVYIYIKRFNIENKPSQVSKSSFANFLLTLVTVALLILGLCRFFHHDFRFCFNITNFIQPRRALFKSIIDRSIKMKKRYFLKKTKVPSFLSFLFPSFSYLTDNSYYYRRAKKLIIKVGGKEKARLCHFVRNQRRNKLE